MERPLIVWMEKENGTWTVKKSNIRDYIKKPGVWIMRGMKDSRYIDLEAGETSDMALEISEDTGLIFLLAECETLPEKTFRPYSKYHLISRYCSEIKIECVCLNDEREKRSKEEVEVGKDCLFWRPFNKQWKELPEGWQISHPEKDWTKQE